MNMHIRMSIYALFGAPVCCGTGPAKGAAEKELWFRRSAGHIVPRQINGLSAFYAVSKYHFIKKDGFPSPDGAGENRPYSLISLFVDILNSLLPLFADGMISTSPVHSSLCIGAA